MMRIKQGPHNKAIQLQISGMPKNARIAIRRSMFLIGKRLVQTAKAGMKSEPKRGRTYKTRGRNIRASAPGQYPAVRSGTLRRSLDFSVQGSKFLKFGAGADYAAFVHDGTRRMKPRPFLTKANNQVRKNVSRITDNEFRKVVNKR